jgi:gamma-D-glutamyl-L-lysine dipeptidyl-peptidase
LIFDTTKTIAMPLLAICCVPLCALRKAPAHEAEMTSQLLFGEAASIMETVGNLWYRVKANHDGYEGWCQQSHLVQIDLFLSTAPLLAAGWHNTVLYNGSPMQVPYGSSLTGFEQGKAIWGDDMLEFAGPTWDSAQAAKDAATITALAHIFINTAYLWGGRSVFGVDCSGFTQTVFRFLGVALPRDAHQQAAIGTTVDFLQQVRCGDLAFFDDENGKIIHVGLLLNEGEIIHAAGKVRVDKMDNAGIVHAQTGAHTHRLRIIKRYW